MKRLDLVNIVDDLKHTSMLADCAFMALSHPDMRPDQQAALALVVSMVRDRISDNAAEFEQHTKAEALS